MRLSVFSDGIYPFQMGGMQRHTYLLVKYMAMVGVEVDLFTSATADITREQYLDTYPIELWPNISIHLVEYPRLRKFPGHYLLEEFIFSKRLASANEKNGPSDFIYTKGFTGWYLLIKRFQNIASFPPIGVKFHGMNMFQPQANLRAHLQKYLFRWPARWIMKQSDVVFSYGGKITDIIIDQGIPREKILSIPTGIEEDWLLTSPKNGIDNSKRRFLFIGRFDRVKGLPELYDAIAKLKSENVEFHFVGPIPDRAQLKKDNCFYLGSITDKSELIRIIDNCHFLVCPSHSEGMPNVILEVMARGLPVLATDTGAVNMLVNASTGLLIKSVDSEVIAKGLYKLVNISTAEYSTLSNNCRQLVLADFRWKRVAERTKSSIERIIQ